MRSGWTTAQTVAMLKRNFYTAALHGAATYWYDMGCDETPDGCFGGRLMPEATAAIWGNLSLMTKAVLTKELDNITRGGPTRTLVEVLK